MHFTEYCQYDGLGLTELVKTGQVSAGELLDTALAATAKLNPSLNAVIHTCEDRAHKMTTSGLPEGPFHGVPFLLKDLFGQFAGEPLTMGSRAVAGYIPAHNSFLVDRYIAAGLNIFGKTNCPEFGLTITTEPKLHGPAHNPHKRGFSPGGSSGGSASAVAAGIVPMANGDDGGGSIRLPASWCGLVGLKPSRGRTPNGPDFGPLWYGAIVQHALTRSVRDSAALLDCTAGPEPGAAYDIASPKGSFLHASENDPETLKIGLWMDPLVPGTRIDPEVSGTTKTLAAELETLGHAVEPVSLAIDTERYWRAFIMMSAAEIAAVVDTLSDKLGKKVLGRLEPATQNLVMLGRSFSSAQLSKALRYWHEVDFAVGTILERFDAICCPTVPTTAARHGELLPGKFDELLLSIEQPHQRRENAVRERISAAKSPSGNAQNGIHLARKYHRTAGDILTGGAFVARSSYWRSIYWTHGR